MENLTNLEAYCKEKAIACGRDVLLARRCTFKIGGPAALLVQPNSPQAVADICAGARRFGVALFVFGGGANLLFADEGFPGAAVQIGAAMSGMRLAGECAIECGSGAKLSQLCLFAWEQGLSGLEFAYGIPGSVGGAIYMNAGAYDGEIKDVLLSARHVDEDGTFGEFAGEELDFSYRHSAYSGGGKVILSGTFGLRPGDKFAIRARMDELMERRRAKQPLEYPSAGSVFRRPQGAFASALIDQCGLKGRRIGGAQVSEKHAGFIVNTGGATAADVRALIALVQREVKAQTGFKLVCEVRIVS